MISIHTFLAEGDQGILRLNSCAEISTHTFLTEGDAGERKDRFIASTFQPTPSSRKVTNLTVVP